MSKPLEIFLLYLLVIVSLLITLSIHELGHFLFARFFNVHVKEYSLGVGPVIWSKKTKKNKLLISFKLFPIIAYVLLDSNSLRKAFESEVNHKKYNWYMEPTPEGKLSLESTKTWQYILIMLGGVMFNFVLFLILLGPLYGYAFAIQIKTDLLNPFYQLGLTIINIGRNMVFIGDGSIIGQIPDIAENKNWLFIMFNSLVMLNLITAVLNLIPFPPLDGWKIYSKSYESIRHKQIKPKTEEYLMWFGLILLFWIFVSPFINDLIPRNETSVILALLS